MRLLLWGCLIGSATGFSLEQFAPKFFEWFSKSEAVAKVHAKHVKSETVSHMMKGTPLASAPASAKLDFARGRGGEAVAEFMRMEQKHIGTWKVKKIVEAAGADFDADKAHSRLLQEIASQPVVMFSFVDCPWCLLAKETLRSIEASPVEPLLPDGGLRVVELEDLGRDGKALRAAISLATGRTSMPSIWIGGRCVGGHTDGDMPGGDAALCLLSSPGLEEMVRSGSLSKELERAAAGPPL